MKQHNWTSTHIETGVVFRLCLDCDRIYDVSRDRYDPDTDPCPAGVDWQDLRPDPPAPIQIKDYRRKCETCGAEMKKQFHVSRFPGEPRMARVCPNQYDGNHPDLDLEEL